MRRGLVLGALIVVGALSLAVSGQAPPAGPSAQALAATKIEKVKDNLYVITGSGAADQAAFSGGNTAVFITDAGVTIVDTKLPGWGQIILDRVKTVTIFGERIPVKASVHTFGGLSGHAGQDDLLKWFATVGPARPRGWRCRWDDLDREPPGHDL